ncbi:MAG: T9SS type A sorting domain-containing protein [Candidatus Kapaibacterium sp.]
MKKTISVLAILVIGFFVLTGQNIDNESPKWSQAFTHVYPLGNYVPLPSHPDRFVRFTTSPRQVETTNGIMVVTPSVRVLPSTTVAQTELYLASNKANRSVLFGSSNNVASSTINSGCFVSTDNGVNWGGYQVINSGNPNDQRGDPGPVVDKNMRFVFSHLVSATNFGSLTGMGANYSTNYGANFSSTWMLETNSNVDKNLSGTDDSPTSPYYGNSYTVWCNLGTSTLASRFSRTTNGGVTWEPYVTLSTGLPGHYVQGHDVAAGPNGQVYVTWVSNMSASPFAADYLGFAKSTNGGVNFTANDSAVNVTGARSSSFGGWGLRVNDFPRIDVDKSGGERNGWIYIVMMEINHAPAGSDEDVVIYRSSNQGMSWMPGVRVNQDVLNNGKRQFFPAVKVDDAGGVNVIYYDNRNFPNADSATVMISRSIDGGATFSDFEITDHHFRPRPATGMSGGYMGDYIGIAIGANKVFGFWMDDKASTSPGFYNAWTASFLLDPGPLFPFTLQTPSAGSTITSFPGSSTQVTLTWDTSKTGASYKWIFGTALPARLLSLSSGSNSLTLTLGELDNILAGLGVNQGSSISGSWDVWAFRNNAPANDSLKSSNGPRTITLARGTPSLTPFSLNAPANNTTIVTSVFNNSNININWTRSGAGTNYKWKFGAPTITTPLLTIPSGFDSSFSIVNAGLDALLGSIGINPGDSISGEWAVWAYNATDSLKSAQTYNLKLRRQNKGTVIVLYDSSNTVCRRAKDSTVSVLNRLNVTYDLFNRGSQTSTLTMSLRGYKTVMLLGEASSLMNARLKDSVKAYLNSGGTTLETKSKLIIFSENIGYIFGRSASTYYDLNFVNTYLGLNYTADRPGVAANGLIGTYVNTGIADSTVGSYPDALKVFTIAGTQQHILYRFRSRMTSVDTLSGIGIYNTKWNVASFGVDLESLRPTATSPPTSPMQRFIKAGLDYVNNTLVGVEQIENEIPSNYSLNQNYPNPFNPMTKINFAMPKQGLVTLRIYDVLGREVRTLVNEVKTAGYHTVDFDGSQFSSGIYFYRLETNGFSDIRKMMLIK